MKAYFQHQRPAGQFLGLLTVFLFNALIWSAIGSLLVRFIWGIDTMANPEVLDDLSDPSTRGAFQVLMFAQHMGFIFTALLFAKLTSPTPKEYLLFDRKPNWKFALGALALMIFSWPLVNWLIELNLSLRLPESMADLEASMRSLEESAAHKFDMMQAHSSFGNLLVNIGLIALLPAIGEELVFRGIVMRLLARWTKNIHWGVWLSAAIFSFVHFQFYGFLPRMLLGVLFGYLLVWSGTIWVPILVHFFNNASTLVLHWMIQKGTIPADVDAFGAEGQYLILALSIVLTGLVMFLFKRNSQWQRLHYEFMLH